MRRNVKFVILQVIVKVVKKLEFFVCESNSLSWGRRLSAAAVVTDVRSAAGLIMNNLSSWLQSRGVRHSKIESHGVNFWYFKQVAESRGSHHSDVEGRDANIKDLIIKGRGPRRPSQ